MTRGPAPAEATDLISRVRAAAARRGPGLRELRRTLHRHPEIGLDLPITQAAVVDALAPLGIPLVLGASLTSVVARIDGAQPGPVILLRGDMDALAVPEQSDEDFSSEVPGVMHACGHDLHTAGLVGAAQVLWELRNDLPGTVVCAFQPGEEEDGGAGLMLEEGLLETGPTRPVAAYGIHVHANRLPRGTFGTRVGTMTAASDLFDITVNGRGGHAGAPAAARDPVPVAAEIVLALQTIASRTRPHDDPVVVTVGSVHTGTARNVIPSAAVLSGTIRTFSSQARTQVCDQVRSIAEHVAAAHGMTADLVLVEGYPPLCNDADEFAHVADTVGALFGPDRFRAMPAPVGGAEDFAMMLREVPGCYVFAGAGHEGTPFQEQAANHSAQARFDDEILTDCAALLSLLALRRASLGTPLPSL